MFNMMENMKKFAIFLKLNKAQMHLHQRPPKQGKVSYSSCMYMYSYHGNNYISIVQYMYRPP